MNAPLPPEARMESLEAEVAVLSGLLLSNRALDAVSDILLPEHFANELYRSIYAEICSQIGKGLPCDTVTIYEAMKGAITLVELNEIAQYVTSASGMKGYAKIIVDRHASRQLAAVSHEIHELACNHEQSIEERIEQAQGQLSKLLRDSPRDEWVSAHVGMLEHAALIEAREQGRIQSMETGLADLDGYLEGGLRTGSLVVIGARPSHGKTALGMSIGLHMARTHSVGLLSMEMPHRDVRDRMTAMLGRVSLSSVIRPHRGEGLAWDRVLEGTEMARGLRFHVSDQSGLNINQVKAKARSLKRLHGLDVLVVDYIGLMNGLDSKQSRAYQIEEITKGLKSLSKELDMAVIALSQLNRSIEQRMNREPQLSDFRDSGAIEQDADIVLGMHREIVDKPDLGGIWPSYAKLSILKNRQGRIGYVNLHYQGDQTLFTSWYGDAPTKETAKASAKRGFQD